MNLETLTAHAPHLTAALFALLYVRQTLRVVRLRAAVARLKLYGGALGLVCAAGGFVIGRNLANTSAPVSDE